MKKITITGSASLQEKINYWMKKFKEKGFTILDWPRPVDEEKFMELYPEVHKDFFRNILESGILFLMNEDKKGIEGYIGAESFAELCFGVIQKLLYGKNIEVILLKMPSKEVFCYDEICLWLELGWIKLYEESSFGH